MFANLLLLGFIFQLTYVVDAYMDAERFKRGRNSRWKHDAILVPVVVGLSWGLLWNADMVAASLLCYLSARWVQFSGIRRYCMGSYMYYRPEVTWTEKIYRWNWVWKLLLVVVSYMDAWVVYRFHLVSGGFHIFGL